jgi:hypothetical protein
MHPIVVQQMAQQRIDTLTREAEMELRARSDEAAAGPRPALRERLSRTAIRLSLTIRGSLA